MPARHLSASSGAAVARVSYDTTELPTEVGEVLEVLAEDWESGWLWCHSGAGRGGLGAVQHAPRASLNAVRAPSPNRDATRSIDE